MASDISREKDALEEKANKAASELIPAGTEERVREWYRWLELAFRQTRP